MNNSSVHLQNVADWYIRHCCARLQAAGHIVQAESCVSVLHSSPRIVSGARIPLNCRKFARHFKGDFLKTTCAGSSPPTPASQCGLCCPCPDQKNGPDVSAT